MYLGDHVGSQCWWCEDENAGNQGVLRGGRCRTSDTGLESLVCV